MYSIVADESKGENERKVVANTNFKAGDLILDDLPYTATISNENATIFCHSCFERKENLVRCSSCKFTRYCSKTCQKQHWIFEHKIECQGIKNILPKIPTETMILVARLFLHKQVEKLGKIKYTNSYKDIKKLLTHRKEREDQQVKYYTQATLIFKILEEKIPVEEIVETMWRLQCNSYNISDLELRPIGIGLYPKSSFINHSCKPNCSYIFLGRKVYIRSLTEIKKGEEITISYIDLNTKNRKKELKENFFFDCKCNCCLDDEFNLFLTGFRCQEKSCNSMINIPDILDNEDLEEESSKCLKGHINSDFNVLLLQHKESRTCFETGENFKKEQNFEDSLNMYQKSFRIQEKILHKFNIERLTTLNCLVNICIDSQKFEKASFYCSKTIEPYTYLYTKNWPLLGLQYLTNGRLLWFLQDSENAYPSLIEAYRILSFTHQNTFLLRDLQQTLEDCRNEINVRNKKQNRLV